MTITSTVAIDLVDRDRYPLAQVYAKQDDSLSRAIAASIYAAGVAWVPPSGATAVIRYRRPDGIGGIYDELPDGSVAYTIADNVITAYIAPDALSCPGRVRMDIVIVNGTEALATFDISVLVDAAPTSGVAPTNGYYKYKTLADINAALAARVQSVNNQAPDNKGNVQINAEQTGAVSRTAFDAAMTTVVRKVNGVTPDSDGNVNVSAESGGNVLSVNSQTGAVQIPTPASGVCSIRADIPAKVVESVSQGASPTHGALVYVKFEAANTAGNPTLTFMGYTAPIVDGDGNAVAPGALTAGTHGFQRRGETWVLLDGSGAAGEDGGYYAPSVDSGGNLTWTASRAGMPQVSGANIKGPKGDTGQQGPAGADGGKGVGIASIARTSGTGAAGTTDTYTITLTDGSTSTFTVYNGKDGASGSGSSTVTSVNGQTGDVKLPVSGFGTCATAAATAIKVVDGLSEDFLVEDGVQLCVKFSNANTAAAPQLSVAGASAPIFDARTSNNVDAAGIGARTHHFVYFSGIWVLLDGGVVKDGVGIQFVEQTTTSADDGGTNVITVTKTDGTSSTFAVRNGSRGSVGPAGTDGQPGADGKSAYQYAQEGGYIGTEAEFAAKLAVEMPDKLPNPNALTFTGAVTGSYDGSEEKTINIPSGGGSADRKWALIKTLNVSTDVAQEYFDTDDKGDSFSAQELLIEGTMPDIGTGYLYCRPGEVSNIGNTIIWPTKGKYFKWYIGIYNNLLKTTLAISNNAIVGFQERNVSCPERITGLAIGASSGYNEAGTIYVYGR